MLMRMPVEDPVKHGYWTVLKDCNESGWYCSHCHKKIYDTEHDIKKRLKRYCPNCGTKMDMEAPTNEEVSADE